MKCSGYFTRNIKKTNTTNFISKTSEKTTSIPLISQSILIIKKNIKPNNGVVNKLFTLLTSFKALL